MITASRIRRQILFAVVLNFNSVYTSRVVSTRSLKTIKASYGVTSTHFPSTASGTTGTRVSQVLWVEAALLVLYLYYECLV